MGEGGTVICFPLLLAPVGFLPPLSPQPPFHPHRGGKGEPHLTTRAGNGNIEDGCDCVWRVKNLGCEFRAPEAGGLNGSRRATCFFASSRPRSGSPCRAAMWEPAPTLRKGRGAQSQSQPSPVSPSPKAKHQMRLPSSARRGGRGAGGSEWGQARCNNRQSPGRAAKAES